MSSQRCFASASCFFSPLTEAIFAFCSHFRLTLIIRACVPYSNVSLVAIHCALPLEMQTIIYAAPLPCNVSSKRRVNFEFLQGTNFLLCTRARMTFFSDSREELISRHSPSRDFIFCGRHMDLLLHRFFLVADLLALRFRKVASPTDTDLREPFDAGANWANDESSAVMILLLRRPKSSVTVARSLPARSMRFSLLDNFRPLISSRVCRTSWMMQWDRLETEFALV